MDSSYVPLSKSDEKLRAGKNITWNPPAPVFKGMPEEFGLVVTRLYKEFTPQKEWGCLYWRCVSNRDFRVFGL